METGSSGEPSRAAWDVAVLRRFVAATRGFWSGPTRLRAIGLTFGVFCSAVLIIAINYGVNRWNGWFFNALERRDAAAAWSAVLVFPLLVFCAATAGVIMVLFRETLQVRWREWIVRRLMDRWILEGHYHRLPAHGQEPASPEYRIADDVRMASEPIIDLYIGIVSSVLTGITFFSVLWAVGGDLKIGQGENAYTIPSFMVLAAILYGATTTTLAFILGKPLVRKVALRNETEARLRFSLSRVRENAMPIARGRAEVQEIGRLGQLYDLVARRWLDVVRTNANLSWVTNSHGVLVTVFPLLVATPKYMSGALSLGEVVQLGSAFFQVQIAIGWLADNMRMLAPCYASVHRVVEIVDAMDGDRGPSSATAPDRNALLTMRDVTLNDREGVALVSVGHLDIAPGDILHIEGPAGSGKTVLTTALAGLWPKPSGQAALGEHVKVMAVGPRAWLPDLGLAALLGVDRATAMEDARRVLDLCELPALADFLDENAPVPALSDSERRRLAIARALMHRPDILILDDALHGLSPGFVERIAEALFQPAGRAALVLTGFCPVLPAGCRTFRLEPDQQGCLLRPLTPVLALAKA